MATKSMALGKDANLVRISQNAITSKDNTKSIWKSCIDVDECEFAECQPGWSCQNTVGSYYCSGCVENDQMLPMPVNVQRSDFEVGFPLVKIQKKKSKAVRNGLTDILP